MRPTIIKAKFISTILLPLLAAVLFTGCGRTEPPPKSTGKVENIDQIVNAVPDEEMKERWRKAEEEGQLPDLGTLNVPDEPVDRRSRATVETPAIAERQPQPLSEEAVADLRLFSKETVDRYSGSFKITAVEDNLVVGTLEGREQPLEIRFKLPGEAKMIEIKPDDAFALTLREEVENNSLRKMVLLENEAKRPVLMYLSEGGATPYEKKLEAPPLSIRQVEEEGKESPSVEVTYGEQMLMIQPGERKQAKDEDGELEIFLMTSYRCPPARRLSAEGDLYHVTLIIYRVAPP